MNIATDAEVEQDNQIVHRACPFVETFAAAGFLPLNMPSIRSVTTNPPTTLSVPNTTATNRMI